MHIEAEIYTGDLATDMERFSRILQTPGMAGFDTETTIDTARNRECCLIQITHENGEEAAVFTYPNGMKILHKLFADGIKATLVAHNALFDTEVLVKAGISPQIECTMVAAKVLRGTMEGDKTGRVLWSLKALAKRELGTDRDKTLQDSDWRIPPTPEQLAYGMADTRDCLALWHIYSPLFADDPGQWDGYRIIADAFLAIAETNMHGLPFDREAHEALIETLTKDQADSRFMLDLDCLDQIENHGSGKQVATWMMDLMLANYNEDQQRDPTVFSLAFARATGQHWPLTKTGAVSLDRKSVESRLASLSEAAPDVARYLVDRLAWSKVTKLLQAFGPTLVKFIDEREYATGSLRPHGAQTSRMSMNSANLQQMPAEPEFRRIFKAKKGRKLVVCDYGQIELRVGCIIADDKVMQAVFASGEDIHRATATNIKRLLTGDDTVVATDLERKKSKATTFGCIAAGSLVLTPRGEIPIESVLLTDKVWDGVEWVVHQGVVWQGYRKVVTSNGITGTPDHKVYLHGGTKVRLDNAREGQVISTGNGRQALRLPAGYGNGDIPVPEPVPVYSDDVPGLRSREATVGGQPSCGEGPALPLCVQRSAIRPGQSAGEAPNRTAVAGTVHSSPAAMHQSEQSGVAQLRGAGDTDAVSNHESIRGSCPHSPASPDVYRSANRQDTQQRLLRRGKPAPVYPVREPFEQAEQPNDTVHGWASGSEPLMASAGDRLPGIQPEQGDSGTACSRGQVAGAHTICSTPQKTAHVYDILNAGPRHRFTVSDKLVSNSLYGAMAATIAVNSGLSMEEAQGLLDLWLGVYTGIREYRETAFETAKANGGVRLISGQFIRIAPDTRAAQAVNAPVQGSAASVMYLAMTTVHGHVLTARAEGRDIWLGATIHDEVILDCAEEDAEEGKRLLEKGMIDALLELYPQCADLGMATLADAGVVDSWAEK